MSLLNQAIVHIAQNVLLQQTWAGDLVFAQPVDPIGDVLRAEGGEQKPILAVYVDSADFAVENRQTQGNSAHVEFKVFVYVAPGRVELPDDVVDFTLDTATAGLTLNLMSRQVDNVLFHRETAWASVFRKFVAKVTERKTRYMLVEVEGGVKVPTMEISYAMTTIPDPNFGEPMKPGWIMLDTELRKTGEGAILADLFKSMIEQPDGLPDYQILQSNFGLTDAALRATGEAPYDPASVLDPSQETPLLTDFDSVGTAAVGPIDED